jgi:hypothetical protein
VPVQKNNSPIGQEIAITSGKQQSREIDGKNLKTAVAFKA